MQMSDWTELYLQKSPSSDLIWCDLLRLRRSVGLSQSVEHSTAERVAMVASSIPGAEPTLRVLKLVRNEGTAFALQTGLDPGGTFALLG